MPAPIVFGHVAKSGVDPTLGCDGMRTSREEFRYACSLEPSFCESDSSPKASSSSADNDCIIMVINNLNFGVRSQYMPHTQLVHRRILTVRPLTSGPFTEANFLC